jgi:hypothetical protein
MSKKIFTPGYRDVAEFCASVTTEGRETGTLSDAKLAATARIMQIGEAADHMARIVAEVESFLQLVKERKASDHYYFSSLEDNLDDFCAVMEAIEEAEDDGEGQ